jgi:hypothetical protein
MLDVGEGAEAIGFEVKMPLGVAERLRRVERISCTAAQSGREYRRQQLASSRA